MALTQDHARRRIIRQLFRDYSVYVEETYMVALGKYRYRAAFQNGVEFESDTPDELADQVRTYAEATKKLTGVYP